MSGTDEMTASSASTEETKTPALETAQTEETTDEKPEAEKAQGETPVEQDDDDERPGRRSRSARLRDKVAQLAAENAELRARFPSQGAADDTAVIRAEVERRIGAAPKESDYANDYVAFDRAMVAYEAAKRISEGAVREALSMRAETAQAARREIVETYEDRADAARKALPDFDRVMASAPNVNNHVAELILSDENGPQIAYHLAKNPKLIGDLNAMHPLQAAREIGRLAANVATPSKRTTQAPPPVKPAGSASSPSSDPAKMSTDEYFAYRRKSSAR